MYVATHRVVRVVSPTVHHVSDNVLGAAERPKLSDGGHEAHRWQPRRPAAVRCSAWLGRRLPRLFLALQVALER